MTDDTEARLRAALHAYADLVDAPDTDLPRPAPVDSVRRTALRRWRGPAMAAAAVVVVTGGAWWALDDRPGGEAVVAGTTAGEQSSPQNHAAEPSTVDSGTEAAAGAPTTRVGVPQPLDLLTHCGVLGTDVGGTWFAVDPPLTNGAGSAPVGWGNPYQPGTLTLSSPSEAVFTDDAGHRVLLHAAPDSARPAPCD